MLAFGRTLRYNVDGMKEILYILVVLMLLAGCGKQEMSAEELAAAKKEFFKAAEAGDIGSIKELIEAGVDVKAKDENGRTALHKAAEKDHFEIVKLLIEKGADVNIADNGGNTPLHHAKSKKVAELLLTNGANINAKNEDDETLLHPLLQSPYEYEDLVNLYISKGADVNARNSEGFTPLDLAVDKRPKTTVEALREAGAEHGNPLGRELLNMAEKGDLARVKELIKQGANIYIKDSWGCTPILEAALKGHLEIVKLLIDCGAEVNVVNKETNQTVLHMASKASNSDLVKFLIAKGADVDAIDYWKNTPLFSAASGNKKEIVEILISAGACVDFRNDNGETPLWRTTYYESLDAAKVLIANGADINAKVPRSVLQATGADAADVKVKVASNHTPLHYSAYQGHKEFAKLLIDKGAYINALDIDGNTPLDVTKYEEMKQLLRKHGAVSGKELKEKEEEK